MHTYAPPYTYSTQRPSYTSSFNDYACEHSDGSSLTHHDQQSTAPLKAFCLPRKLLVQRAHTSNDLADAVSATSMVRVHRGACRVRPSDDTLVNDRGQQYFVQGKSTSNVYCTVLIIQRPVQSWASFTSLRSLCSWLPYAPGLHMDEKKPTDTPIQAKSPIPVWPQCHSFLPWSPLPRESVLLVLASTESVHVAASIFWKTSSNSGILWTLKQPPRCPR